MLKVHLQLFAEGGAAPAEGAAVDANGTDLNAAFEAITGVKGEFAAPGEAEEADAAAETGGEAASGDVAGPAETFEDAFKALKERFPEELEKHTRSQMNDRFKQMRVLEGELAKAKKEVEDVWAASDPYLKKLGIERGDIEAYKTAAMKDKANFNKLAYQNGTTPEEEMEKYASSREVAEKQKAEEAEKERKAHAEEQQRRDAVYAQWEQDADEIRKTDPGFDLRKTIRENEDFRKALNAGLSVKFAYNAVNHERIMAGVAGAVAQKTASDVTRSISSRQARPNEGAVRAAAPGSATQKDWGRMSDEEFLKAFHGMGF